MKDGTRPPDRDQPIDEAGEQADSEAEHDGHGHRQVPGDERLRQHGRAQRQDRPDGEIDAAGDEHQCHANRDHRQRRDLVGQRGERDAAEEVVAQRAEQDEERDQDGRQAEVLAVSRHLHRRSVIRSTGVCRSCGLVSPCRIFKANSMPYTARRSAC